MNFLAYDDDFSALSIEDLLQAREEFHLHLLHKANVVGTAIGRYRIRKSDPWPSSDVSKPKSAKTVRTLQNSEVRPYSWPAILVFVSQWEDETAFNGASAPRPQDFVPPAIYMADGRKAPICVIKAEANAISPPWDANYSFPTNLIGGGFPLLVDVQGQEHVASVGCLVTDGHRTYALTNRHVAGEAGTPIYSIIGGNKVRIGVSAGRSLRKASFESVYPGWLAKNVFVDLDAALLDIDDLNVWTTQVYGLGKIGKLADLATDNMSLRLIGGRVSAFGAASRLMHGEIAALFYRFKSVGGFEYVSDFLIGPTQDHKSLGTHPGDSGTLWTLDQPAGAAPLPLALQWGGQVFSGGKDGQGSSYALASALSTICESLDVDLVRDWNEDQIDYWGAVGHYGIANKAIGHLPDGKLAKLMAANLEQITFQIEGITKKGTAGLSTKDFVPLADVPDLVWKVGPHKRGGPSSAEHPNHFADMDRVLSAPLPEGDSLLTICAGGANVDVAVWQRYYDQVKAEHPKQDESRGLLPFRAWQIFDAMVYFLKQGDVERFLCAAGILSHYVGDACQPLHISYLFNGDPDRATPTTVTDRKSGAETTKLVSYGAGVHSAYEDDMIDYHVGDLWPAVDAALGGLGAGVKPADGHAAAGEVVVLMQATFAKIRPMDIVDAYVGEQGETPKAAADALWTRFGSDTARVIAAGSDCLARLWQGAWAAGQGDANIANLGVIAPDTLAAIYQPFTFLQSETLDTISPVLNTGNGGADGTIPIQNSTAVRPPARNKRIPGQNG